jgi:hypothetical protein
MSVAYGAGYESSREIGDRTLRDRMLKRQRYHRNRLRFPPLDVPIFRASLRGRSDLLRRHQMKDHSREISLKQPKEEQNHPCHDARNDQSLFCGIACHVGYEGDQTA